jgi:hypothetical protein
MFNRSERDETSDEALESDEGAGCTRCDGRLIFLGRKDFHEGTRGWGFIFGDLGELLTGGEEIEMWTCESCGHIEFFLPKK